MEEAHQPRVPVEPSEDELRAMLEDREKKQAGDWGQRKRLATRILMVFTAIGALVFFGSGLHKDIAAAMSPEPPEPAPPKVKAALADPAATPVGRAESVETVLKQSSGYDPTPAKAKPGNGKIIDQDDIRFTMQLMNFMQGPQKHEARPAAKAKDGK